MAECRRFVCSNCDRAIEVWSDGNPYYLDGEGTKHYAHHPGHDGLAKCIGNDVPHLCLTCGTTCNVDSRAPREQCPSCDARPLVPTGKLGGRQCPYCEDGIFEADPAFFAVS